MSITFRCHDCGKHYQVSEAMAGKKVRCRGCAGVLTVPDAPLARQATPSGRSVDDGPAPPSSRPGPPASAGPASTPPSPPSRPKSKPVPMFLDVDDDDDMAAVAESDPYDDLGDVEEPPPLHSSGRGRGKDKGRSGVGVGVSDGGLATGQWLRIGGITAAVVVPLLLLIALLLVVSGSSALKRHREVSAEGVVVVEELAALLGEVRDVDSARRVGPRATEAAQRLAMLSHRAAELPRLSDRDTKRLRDESQSRRQEAIDRLRAEVARLRGLPDVRAALAPVAMAVSF